MWSTNRDCIAHQDSVARRDSIVPYRDSIAPRRDSVAPYRDSVARTLHKHLFRKTFLTKRRLLPSFYPLSTHVIVDNLKGTRPDSSV